MSCAGDPRAGHAWAGEIAELKADPLVVETTWIRQMYEWVIDSDKVPEASSAGIAPAIPRSRACPRERASLLDSGPRTAPHSGAPRSLYAQERCCGRPRFSAVRSRRFRAGPRGPLRRDAL